MPAIRTAKGTSRAGKAASAKPRPQAMTTTRRKSRGAIAESRLDQELMELSFIEDDLRRFCQKESELWPATFGNDMPRDSHVEEIDEDVKTLEGHIEDLQKRSDRINKYIVKNKLIDKSGSDFDDLAQEAKDEVGVLLGMGKSTLRTFKAFHAKAPEWARKFAEMDAEMEALWKARGQHGDDEEDESATSESEGELDA